MDDHIEIISASYPMHRTKEDYASALLELETWRRQSDQSANEVEQKDRQIGAIQREVGCSKLHCFTFAFLSTNSLAFIF